MSIWIKKESSWKFITSSSGGIGVEFVAAEGGKIWLQDPSGKTVPYYYGAAGGGWAVGLKLPKVKKLQIKGKSVAGGIAPAAFPNIGMLYVLETFEGEELEADDISGVCVFVEVYGAVIAGGSATAMMFGMSPLWLAAALALGPAAFVAEGKLLASATGILLMAGLNVGTNAGVGIGAFVGGLV